MSAWYPQCYAASQAVPSRIGADATDPSSSSLLELVIPNHGLAMPQETSGCWNHETER